MSEAIRTIAFKVRVLPCAGTACVNTQDEQLAVDTPVYFPLPSEASSCYSQVCPINVIIPSWLSSLGFLLHLPPVSGYVY
jgi:hypothetical protein